MVNTKGSFFVGNTSVTDNKDSKVTAKELYTSKNPHPKVAPLGQRHSPQETSSHQIKTQKNSTLAHISTKARLNQSPYRMANLRQA